MINITYKAVKIPFATKKYYSSKFTEKTNKYKIWGHAYYIYDPLTGNIGKQFLQIEGGEFRPTDREMKLTCYWKSMLPYSKKYREEFLTLYNSDNISKLEHLKGTLNSIGIKKFNELSFKFFKKAKKNFDLLTGSNWGGSKGDNSKAAFKYYNFEIKKTLALEDEFHLHNFVDFFNSIRIFKHPKFEEIKIEDLQTIKLKEYLDTFKKQQSNDIFDSAKRVFKSFNYFAIDNIDESEEILEILNSIYEGKSINKTYEYIKKNLKDQKYIKKEIDETIEEYQKKLITEKTLKSRLRIRQKNLVSIEFNDLKENNKIEANISSHLLKEYSGQDHSHIISVRKCFDNEDYYSIADNNNCLLIPGAYHKMLTENQITFNPKGYLVDRELKINDPEVKIDKIFLTKERIKFLEENYQNWIEYKENIQ